MSRFLSVLSAVSLLVVSSGADWPTYRGDAARSGYTQRDLAGEAVAGLDLSSRCTLPQPAWPRDDRMLFDRAPDVVVAGGVLFFGSSADGQVIALDAATGQQRWTFFTDAPVRFAPAIWKDRVFVVSDDGYLYCLALADGSLIQRWRGGPTDEMILGNGRMVSRWPARGGPVIRDGIVYFAAGIWQSEGIFLLAIDAESGREVCGATTTPARSTCRSRTAARWPTAASRPRAISSRRPTTLLVPTGRAVPAAFSRGDGQFRYYHLQANGHVGGTQTVAVGAQLLQRRLGLQRWPPARSKRKLGAGRDRRACPAASFTAASASCAC